jgi:serine/threonine protein phosphatase 1
MIYYGNGSIAIDCGAVFGGKLACLCLDNGKEYYI